MGILFLLHLVFFVLILLFLAPPSLTSIPILLLVDLAPSLTVQLVCFTTTVKSVISTVDGFYLQFNVSTVPTLLQDVSSVSTAPIAHLVSTTHTHCKITLVCHVQNRWWGAINVPMTHTVFLVSTQVMFTTQLLTSVLLVPQLLITATSVPT